MQLLLLFWEELRDKASLDLHGWMYTFQGLHDHVNRKQTSLIVLTTNYISFSNFVVWEVLLMLGIYDLYFRLFIYTCDLATHLTPPPPWWTVFADR